MSSTNKNRKNITVGILSHGFIGWGGGLDFIRHMLCFLDEEQKYDSHLRKILILPKETFLDRLKLIAYPCRNLIKQLITGQGLAWKRRPGFSSQYLKRNFADFSETSDIFFSAPNLQAQIRAAIGCGANVVFPCMTIPPENIQLPWVGYLFDFQHHYLPEFFSKEEIESRNKAFFEMLNSAKHIIVYGEEVVRDADRFYPGHTAKLHALPFCPCPQPEWLSNNVDVQKKYQIERPYFLVSNQFWKHKDHATAFSAFGEYCMKGGQADLICTGSTDDYRFPGYFSELLQLIRKLNLENRIKILGHISKADQISLMRNSLAVVQTTLFEGGPGGGCVYDAISLGVPTIVSDIPINRELTCGNITFFPASNAHKLAAALLAMGLNPYPREMEEELLRKGLERRRLAGRMLKNILQEAIRDASLTSQDDKRY